MPERRRVPAVPLAVAFTAAGSWLVYEHASPRVADLAIVPYAFCLVLGPALVYPAVRRGGGSAGAAAAWALLVPALWLAKEMARVTAVFSVAEALYYAMNPIALGLYAAAALQMAVAELAIRRARAGAWRFAGWPAATLATLAVLGAAATAVGADSGGRDIFYGYVALYRALFAGGG
jgi:hypothetical protein